MDGTYFVDEELYFAKYPFVVVSKIIGRWNILTTAILSSIALAIQGDHLYSDNVVNVQACRHSVFNF